MNWTLGRTLGWIAFACGAIWLTMGLWDTFGPNQKEGVFANIVVPIFAMIASTLLISGAMDRRVQGGQSDDSQSLPD